jgi:hypothetical protein
VSKLTSRSLLIPEALSPVQEWGLVISTTRRNILLHIHSMELAELAELCSDGMKDSGSGGNKRDREDGEEEVTSAFGIGGPQQMCSQVSDDDDDAASDIPVAKSPKRYSVEAEAEAEAEAEDVTSDVFFKQRPPSKIAREDMSREEKAEELKELLIDSFPEGAKSKVLRSIFDEYVLTGEESCSWVMGKVMKRLNARPPSPLPSTQEEYDPDADALAHDEDTNRGNYIIDFTKEVLTCLLCQENPRSCILEPCNHLCVCSDCAETKLGEPRRCPYCLEFVLSTHISMPTPILVPIVVNKLHGKLKMK